MSKYYVGWISAPHGKFASPPYTMLHEADGTTFEDAMKCVEDIKRTESEEGLLCVYVIRAEWKSNGSSKYTECPYIETFVDALGHRIPEWRRLKVGGIGEKGAIP